MDWILNVRSYIRVVEEGSFTAAARQLNTTSSALSKRIYNLEDRIGVQLLKRTTRTLTLTEAGSLFYQRSQVQLQEWQSLVDETRSVNDVPAGLLRIGAPLAVGARFLVPYLNDFLRHYPQIKVQLITTVPGQLPELTLDVFISRELEQLNSLSFKATALFQHQPEFFASPQYLEQFGEPLNLDELKQRNVLIWGEQTSRMVTLSNGQRVTLSGNLATTNPEVLSQAARFGMGILFTGKVIISEELERGELVQILPSLSMESTTVYAYYPKLDFEHTRTRLFINYLRERLMRESEKQV